MKYSFFIFLILSSKIYSQEVNAVTGAGTYNLPVFNYSDAKSGLSTSISLNYTSGNGLSVSSLASNVGQNWSLELGGMIIRKQNGEPDDQNSETLFPKNPYGYANVNGHNASIALAAEGLQETYDYIDNYYPNGFMYSEFPVDLTTATPLTYAAPRDITMLPRFRSSQDKNWKHSRRALADREQDVYMYNFNGISGEFVIGKDGNPLLLNDTKIVIDKTTADLTSQNIRTRITQFTIKDANGILYKFGAYETSEVMTAEQTSSSGPSEFQMRTTTGTPTGKYTIQKWLLTEIVNTVTQEKIEFEYESYDLDVVTDKIPTYQYTEGQTTESVQLFEQRSRVKLKRIKNIYFPDGHRAEFIYLSSPSRVDVAGDNPLAQIKIYFDGKVSLTYDLTYGYFFKKLIKSYSETFVESDKRYTRLCLLSVQRTGANTIEPPFKFDYYTGSEVTDVSEIVPPRFCFAQDHWGYYNKSSAVDISLDNLTKEVLKSLMVNAATYRQPSAGAAKLGLLKSIENPYLGKFTFEYEQNDSKDSDAPSVTKTAGGVRVFRTTVHDGISTANDIVTTYYYKATDGSTSGWGYEAPNYQLRRQIRIYNASAPSGYVEEGVLKADITTSFAKFAAKAFLRKAIDAYVGNFSALSGTFYHAVVVYLYVKVISGLVDRLFALFNPTDYVWLNNYDFYPQGAHNQLPIRYSRVQIVNTSQPGGIGKTVQEFAAPSNVRAEIPAQTFPYSAKQRYPTWKYGHPTRQLIYNHAGTLIREMVKTYNISDVVSSSEDHKSNRIETFIFNSAACDAPTYGIDISDMAGSLYYPHSGRTELTNTTEKSYSASGLLSEVSVSYSYNNNYQPFTVTKTKTNGDVITQKTYYASDYDNISPAIQDMKDRNIVAIPISVETWLTKGGNEYLVDAVINEFTKLPNGEIKIKKIYKLESPEPVLKSVIGEKRSDMLVRNPTYFKEQVNYNYDNSNNQVETTYPGGKKEARMYGYGQRHVIAEVTNASSSEIAYTSFETTEKGGWTFDENTLAVSPFGATGKASLHFLNTTPASIYKTVSGGAYILSFWAKGPSPSVFGDPSSMFPATASNTYLNAATGWTYYEYLFQNPTTISITNAGFRGPRKDFSLDELRLYPVNAKMTTTCYDPSVGEITTCDINNRIQHSEYDGLGRLKLIRDDQFNVIKTYEYHYKQP